MTNQYNSLKILIILTKKLQEYTFTKTFIFAAHDFTKQQKYQRQFSIGQLGNNKSKIHIYQNTGLPLEPIVRKWGVWLKFVALQLLDVGLSYCVNCNTDH